MGTSGSYGGPRTGLVPSFLNDPTGAGDAPVAQPSGQPAAAAEPAGPAQPQAAPAAPAFAGSFTGARTALNRFARSGNSDDLRRAASSYVNRGTGGSRRASVRMGASRATAARLISLGRAVQASGAVAALASFQLGAMAGRPAADVFLQLLEFVCPAGSSINEAVSRQAMLDAILHMSEGDVGNFDELTAAQWEEFLIDFVGCSIEGKILSDIGTQALKVPDSVADVGTLQSQLHDFINGCVRSSLGERLDNIASLTDAEIITCVNAVYEAAFEYISLLEDEL
jgi:hypothetical protein